jgi:16S rRNA (adenine1518-N6/adenine1519-N6)-dimethyltransferase
VSARVDGHRARKRFGQHFLHDRRVIERMLRLIGPRPGDRVVEIGPGTGALTLPLLQALGTLEAVEMDRDLIGPLQARAAEIGALTIHPGDALRFDFSQCHGGGGGLRLIGNLPYNISTPLLFHLLDQRELIIDIHVMLQREVVERLTAPPGGGDYGRLSVMVQYHCAAEALMHVGPGAFSPPPAVDSAVVRLTPRPPARPARRPALFATVVARAFAQRRKTLRRALSGLVDAAAFARADIDASLRAERLSVDAFVRLSNSIDASQPCMA